MADPLSSPGALCGVRIERNGPVVFVDARGHDVDPGDLVIVDRGGQESMASVVFGPSQLLANEGRADPAGRIVRLAVDEDVQCFGPDTPATNGAREAGLPSDERLADPSVEPAVHVALEGGNSSAG